MKGKLYVIGSVLLGVLIILMLKLVLSLNCLDTSQQFTIILVILLSAIATSLVIEIVDNCFISDDEDSEDYDVE